MPGLAVEDIPDLVKTTLPHFKNRGKFEAAFLYQQYYFIDEVFQKDKYETQEGKSIDWTVILDENGTARHTGLYATRQRNKKDVVRTCTQRWCFADAEASYEAHELTMNKGPAQITKYIKTQYFAAYVSMANLIERRAVQAPNDATDTENPQGVAFAIAMLDSGVTNYTGGFLGKTARYGDGSTTTTRYGLDSALEPMWRNWGANHNGMNIQTMNTARRGLWFTGFVPPRTVKEMYMGPASKRRFLWSITDHTEYLALVNSGGDDRNGDISPFKDNVSVHGVRPVPLGTLENVAYTPKYCVDFAHFKPCVHSDWWMKEDEPMRDVDQRHVIIQGFDCQYNYICDNLRVGGFVLHEPIP